MTLPNDAPLVLVAAVAKNGAIGGHGRLLWRLRSDMRHFRAATLGKPVIMGRKTWDSIGKPLPGRSIVVVSRNPLFTADGITVEPTLEAAVAHARALAATGGAAEIVIAGGADIYRQTIKDAARLILTEVDLAPIDADSFFPAIDSKIWREALRETPIREKDDECTFAFVDYVRRA